MIIVMMGDDEDDKDDVLCLLLLLSMLRNKKLEVNCNNCNMFSRRELTKAGSRVVLELRRVKI